MLGNLYCQNCLTKIDEFEGKIVGALLELKEANLNCFSIQETCYKKILKCLNCDNELGYCM